VAPSGFGRVLFGFEGGDVETQRILATEAAKPVQDRRLLTFDEFNECKGDLESTPFPLRGWKRVGVVGARDGGKVAVGKLTGHETSNGKSAPNLDWVDRIVFYGEPTETKEEFIGVNRVRYHPVGLTMPRPEDDLPDYYYQTENTPNKARQLREEIRSDGSLSGNLIVLEEDAQGNTIRSNVHDHILSAPGYVDETRAVLGRLQPEIVTEPAELAARLGEALQSGTVVRRRVGDSLEVLANDGVTATIRRGRGGEEGLPEERFAEELRNALQSQRSSYPLGRSTQNSFMPTAMSRPALRSSLPRTRFGPGGQN